MLLFNQGSELGWTSEGVALHSKSEWGGSRSLAGALPPEREGCDRVSESWQLAPPAWKEGGESARRRRIGSRPHGRGRLTD